MKQGRSGPQLFALTQRRSEQADHITTVGSSKKMEIHMMQHKTHCQTVTRTVAPLVAGVFGLLMTASAVAGIPTYKIFFDGGGFDESSIVALNGAASLPEGSCGMSISGADLLAFYWAEYNPYMLGAPMPEPPWGPPSSATYDFPAEALEAVIEFTGPFGDNCEDEWVFHLPLAGDWPVFPNGTPSGAGALVFQITSPNDVEWLNAGFQVWEPPGEGPGQGEDPEFPSFCEQWPDACDEDPGFTYDDPCNSSVWSDVCGDAGQTDTLSLRIERYVQIALHELNIALILPAVQSARESARRTDTAHTAILLALEENASLRKVEFQGRSGKTDTADYAAAIKVRLGVAEIALRGCRNHIEDAQAAAASPARTLKASSARPDPMQAAIAECAAAVESLIAARDQVRRLPAR
ncbi:MAG: hypothetical protein R3F53_23235 [Gammaproteobacteria bacterium]